MSNVWDMHFHTFSQYLTYFAGRTETYTLASKPERFRTGVGVDGAP
jgi:hypothetical protein